MIRVHKGGAPEVLGRLGPDWVMLHSDEYDAHQADYLSGKRKLTIRAHVYGASEVRETLAAAQHGKCCYCEVEIEHPYMLRHVEHWRPKGAVKQGPGELAQYPGYYWLAYDWDNLLLACGVCNSGYKSTVFPLADDSGRARNHHEAVNVEEPRLLKPDRDDPEAHIEWIDDQPRGLTDLGWKTIETVGLVREDDVKRSRAYNELRTAYHRLLKFEGQEHIEVVQEMADDYRQKLQRSVLPTSQYSAMAKGFIAANGIDVGEAGGAASNSSSQNSR